MAFTAMEWKPILINVIFSQALISPPQLQQNFSLYKNQLLKNFQVWQQQTFVLTRLTCLGALRYYAPYVPTCLCAFVSQITTWLRAYVPYVPTCLRALIAYMPLNFTCLRAYMPLNFICLRDFWFYVPACLSNLNYVSTLNCVLMCPKFLRAYAPKKYRVINFNLNVMFF